MEEMKRCKRKNMKFLHLFYLSRAGHLVLVQDENTPPQAPHLGVKISSQSATVAEDTVADGVSNSFLRLLDKSSEKLKERVDKLEAHGEDFNL